MQDDVSFHCDVILNTPKGRLSSNRTHANIFFIFLIVFHPAKSSQTATDIFIL